MSKKIPLPTRPIESVRPYDHKNRYVQIDCIIDWLKDDLISLLSDQECDMFASEYVQDRLQLWERWLKDIQKKDKEKYGN